MIVVITGSRSLAMCDDRLAIKSLFVEMVKNLRPSQVHHGGARGPDSWAAGAFEDIQVCHRPVESLFRTPAQCLMDRNKTMIMAALQQRRHGEDTVLVACWDGWSHGTKDAMDFAELMDVPLVSVPVDLIKRVGGL